MKREQIYKRRQVMEVFNVTKYALARMVDSGILESPIREPGRHPYWVTSQIERAQEKLREKARPVRPLGIRPLSEKQIARIRAYGMPLRKKW